MLAYIPYMDPSWDRISRDYVFNFDPMAPSPEVEFSVLQLGHFLLFQAIPRYLTFDYSSYWAVSVDGQS